MLAGLYLVGVPRSRSRVTGRPWPVWRSGLFLLGLATAAVAVLSPLDALAAELFSAHMVQHMLLLIVFPPLFLLGAPPTPLMRALPRAWIRRIVVPIATNRAFRAVLRVARQPLVAAGLYLVALYAWHVPVLYDAALSDAAVHGLEHLSFVLTGLLFWSCAIDPLPFRATVPHAARIFYLVVVGAAQNLLGALLSFSSRVLYAYAGHPERWGFDALDDQRLGGAIMWAPGSVVFLVAVTAAFFTWMAEEEREQLRREGRA